MNLALKDKVALVTGASRGIGAAVARNLLFEGCRVALTGRDTALLEELRAEEDRDGARTLLLTADLRDPAVPQQLVARTVAHFGAIDAIVANAGAAESGDFFHLPDSAWDDAFAIKFFGHMRLIRAAWPHLERSRGAVAVVAGYAGRTPPAEGAINGSVNAALLSLTKALANLGTTSGVRINAVNPGQIRTQRLQRRIERAVAMLSVDAAEAEARMVKDGGILRIGESADVADLVTFLVSARAGYIHGALIDIDGGLTKTL
jgi:3-oxoacyl-[acyl-carrier protein] reductase